MMNKVETLLGFVYDISLFLALYAYGFFSHKCTAAVILPGRGLGRDIIIIITIKTSTISVTISVIHSVPLVV